MILIDLLVWTKKEISIIKVVKIFISHLLIVLALFGKRFYNRETIASLNYKIQQMSFIPLPFYATQIIKPFLNSIVLANHDKADWLL